MKKNITTIEELEREQEKLKMTMKITRQEFARSIGTNKTQLKDFMLKKVALPVGAVGVGVSALSKFTSSSDKKQKNISKAGGLGLISGLLPIAINLFQTFLVQKQNEKIENKIPDNSQSFSKTKKLQSVA